MMEAFVYCWTNHHNNMLYIGSHKGTEDDGYVCSSKWMMEDYSKNSEYFTRQIIASGSWDDMFSFEGKLLRTIDVKNDPIFYNMHNGSGDFRNKFMTEEAKKKLSKSKTGIPSPNKGRKYGKTWNKGLTGIYSEETLNKLRDANIGKEGYWKGKKLTENMRTNLSQVNFGNNNASKKINTPYGQFNSQAEAARKLPLSRWTISNNLITCVEGWEYI